MPSSITRRFGISIGLILLGLVPPNVAAAEKWGAYRQALAADDPTAPYGVFTLNREVYAHARPDLADLRIQDESGAFVPYAVFEPVNPPEPRTPVTAYNNVFRADGAEVTLDLGPVQAGHDRIFVTFSGAENYLVLVTLEGSKDGKDWGVFLEGQYLAGLRGADGGRITLDCLSYPLVDFRCLRLHYRNCLDAAKLLPTAVQVGTAAEQPAPLTEWPVYMETDSGVDGRSQILTLDLTCSLPVQEIQVRTKTVSFVREAELAWSEDGEIWTPITSDRLFCYPVAGVVLPHDTLTFAPMRAQYLRLRIFNGDDPPLAEISLSVRGRPHELVFSTQNKAGYGLCYGVADAAPAQYDLAEIARSLPPESFSRWSLSGKEEALAGDRHAWLLWAGLAAAVSALYAAFYLARIRKPTRGTE